MRARAELVGARLLIASIAPHGTRVECIRDWPLPARKGAARRRKR
jgi:hypothetical protein